jgi:hypothetical protein
MLRRAILCGASVQALTLIYAFPSIILSFYLKTWFSADMTILNLFSLDLTAL